MCPLSERPIQAEVSQQDLFAWQSQATVQAEAIGTTFVAVDDGPSAEDLLVRLSHLQPSEACTLDTAYGVLNICSVVRLHASYTM